MTQTQIPGVDARPAPSLGERENRRAVELIEAAERSAPHCLCGAHTLAVEHDGEVWLECAEHSKARTGLSAVLSRLTAIGHTRQMIMELPSAD